MLSVELVPAAEIEGRPADHGRSEPSSNPFLPKPNGRLRFTFNPFVMLYRLLGPKICRQLSGCICLRICLILYLAILFYMIRRSWVTFGVGAGGGRVWLRLSDCPRPVF